MARRVRSEAMFKVLRSWWFPWVIILILLLGIGRLGAEMYLVDRGPNSLYQFEPFETPVAFVASDMRLYAYRLTTHSR
jgi:hypothetical protein